MAVVRGTQVGSCQAWPQPAPALCLTHVLDLWCTVVQSPAGRSARASQASTDCCAVSSAAAASSHHAPPPPPKAMCREAATAQRLQQGMEDLRSALQPPFTPQPQKMCRWSWDCWQPCTQRRLRHSGCNRTWKICRAQVSWQPPKRLPAGPSARCADRGGGPLFTHTIAQRDAWQLHAQARNAVQRLQARL